MNRPMQAVAVALCFSASCVYPAFAAEVTRLFGHDVQIVDADGPDQLRIDGRNILADEYLSLEEIVLVGDLPALIGTSSAGGNACDAAPFVVSFPAGNPPRLDGPLAVCSLVSWVAKPGNIVFSTAATPGQPGEAWEWTEAGFKELPPVPFQAADKGWDDLRSRMVDHPAEIYEYAEIGALLDGLLGEQKGEYRSIISGVGGGEFKGDLYRGHSCVPHMCGSAEALLIASLTDRKVFAAWKTEGKPIQVRPVVSQWPSPARQELAAWAEKWK